MPWLDRVIDKYDSVDLSRLLWINAGLALFVLVGHGVPLLAARVTTRPISADEIAGIQELAQITIPIAAVCLALSVLALVRSTIRNPVLMFHTFILAAGAVAMVLWAALLSTPNAYTRFVWNPIAFAFLLAYPVYLGRRMFFPESICTKPTVRYAHVMAIAVSVVVSAIIMWRMFG